jgi:hypothetical protein
MGCIHCTQLESDILDILSEMGIAADLRPVTDFKEIASYGVMGSAALVINNKVVATGEVRREIESTSGLLRRNPQKILKKVVNTLLS